MEIKKFLFYTVLFSIVLSPERGFPSPPEDEKLLGPTTSYISTANPYDGQTSDQHAVYVTMGLKERKHVQEAEQALARSSPPEHLDPEQADAPRTSSSRKWLLSGVTVAALVVAVLIVVYWYCFSSQEDQNDHEMVSQTVSTMASTVQDSLSTTAWEESTSTISQAPAEEMTSMVAEAETTALKNPWVRLRAPEAVTDWVETTTAQFLKEWTQPPSITSSNSPEGESLAYQLCKEHSVDGLWDGLSSIKDSFSSAEAAQVQEAFSAGGWARGNGESDAFVVNTVCANLPPSVREALQFVSPIKNIPPVFSTTEEGILMELSFVQGPLPAAEAPTFLERFNDRLNAAHAQAAQF